MMWTALGTAYSAPVEVGDLTSLSTKAGRKLDRKDSSAKNKHKLQWKLNLYHQYSRTSEIFPQKQYFVH